LAQIGVTRNQSSRYQRLAEIPRANRMATTVFAVLDKGGNRPKEQPVDANDRLTPGINVVVRELAGIGASRLLTGFAMRRNLRRIGISLSGLGCRRRSAIVGVLTTIVPAMAQDIQPQLPQALSRTAPPEKTAPCERVSLPSIWMLPSNLSRADRHQ
jgi:hypothetical protein